MRRKIVAGNWKMNLDHREGAALAGELVSALSGREPECEVVLFPTFTTLPSVAAAIEDSIVTCGAQDLWYEKSGAFTGEISAGMIRSLGCRYVLVGHSERRHIIGEKADLLSKKLRAALDAGLSPVYCVGETLDQRESGKAEKTVSDQVRDVLDGLDQKRMEDVVIAYEPVWAIGTGRTASPDDASSMHAVIREVIREIFGGETASVTPILYGGSVKPDNAGTLLAADDIDGALVGGASLNADSFLGIIFPD